MFTFKYHSYHQYQCIATYLSPTHLCEHGLSILCDHSALITVKGHKVIVEGLLGMFQHVVQLSGAALEYTPEVSWD